MTEVDVVEGNGKERLVLSGIVVYWKNEMCAMFNDISIISVQLK